jgi:1,4-dihydroxy-2-naphthoyl-CoA hydrolase
MPEKPIWFRDYSLEEIQSRGKGTLLENLGIEITRLAPAAIFGRMPVDPRTRQPAGILHGGASVALAESLASTAANLVVDPATHFCVGLEINANHLSSVRDGVVDGESVPVHLGRSTQVWETRISQGERLICVSRMTVAILSR